jgi:hypothetical protein
MTTNDCVTIKEMKGKILGSTANHDTRLPCHIDQLMLLEQDYMHAISHNKLLHIVQSGAENQSKATLEIKLRATEIRKTLQF